MVELTKLTDHDKRLLGAVIGFVLALTSTGNKGMEALLPLAITKPNEWRIILATLQLLASSTEEMDIFVEAVPTSKGMSANLSRLAEIGTELIGEQALDTPPERV